MKYIYRFICQYNSELSFLFLRRSAAEALIQKLEFQTILVSIHPSVRPEKTGKTPNSICIGEMSYSFDENFSRFSRCRKKTAFYEVRNDLPGPLKNRLFSTFEPFQICLHTPSQNDKKLTPAILERSCPRTYLPSRAGATHALRVLSSER